MFKNVKINFVFNMLTIKNTFALNPLYINSIAGLPEVVFVQQYLCYATLTQ